MKSLSIFIGVLVASLGFTSLGFSDPGGKRQGHFSLGLHGGGAIGLEGEGIDGFKDTEFTLGPMYGVSAMYRLPNGYALEVVIERIKMDLEENNDEFGELKITPVMLLFKYQGFPNRFRGKGFTGHAQIGGGYAFTHFSTGGFVSDLERNSGVKIDVETDDSFVFEMGGGLDYFFSPHISMNADIRFMYLDVDTDWTIKGGSSNSTISNIDKFQASHFQFFGGLRYWF